MATYLTEPTGLVPDGSDIDVDFAITDSAGDPLTGFVSVAYKLSDNAGKEIIPWTSITASDTGTINIPGEYNRIESPIYGGRELALYVVYGGTKVATDKIAYTLNEIWGVTIDSP